MPHDAHPIPRHSRLQQRIFVLCWFAYVFAYLLRMNLAVAIPAMRAGEGYTNTQLGMLTSVFFLTYTIGLLLSGYIGDRVRSKVLLTVGLTVSAGCNLGCAFSHGLPPLFLFWGINGLAQSMLWGPLMRTLSLWFDPKSLRRISFYMTFCAVFGYAASWSLASVLSTHINWRAAFFVPALLVIAFTILLLCTFHSEPPLAVRDAIDAASALGDPVEASSSATEEGVAQNQLSVTQLSEASSPDIATMAVGGNRCDVSSADAPSTLSTPGDASSPAAPVSAKRLSLPAYLRHILLPILFFAAAASGMIREGIGVWMPTLLQTSGLFDPDALWLPLVIIPGINLLGVLLVQWILRRMKFHCGRASLLCFGLITCLAAVLAILGGRSAGLALVLMVLLLASTYGMAQIFDSLLPFQYAAHDRVAFTAGLLDCCIYCGAALSGTVSGMLSDGYTWDTVYWFWLAGAVVGLAASAVWTLWLRCRDRQVKQTADSAPSAN